MWLNLETAVRDGKVRQSFDPESFKGGGPFTNRECEPQLLSDSESKPWRTLPSRTAVSRIKAIYLSGFELKEVFLFEENLLNH